MYAADKVHEEWVAGALTDYGKTHDVALRDEIAARTDWLAVRGARRFADRGEPFDDLLQVARLGLIKAIDRYDPTREIPFGAFATPTVVGELRRYFRDHTWGMYVPRRAKELRPRVVAAIEECAHRLGRSPRVAEIAASMGVTEDDVLEAMEAGDAYRPQSLDAQLSSPQPRNPNVDDTDHVIDREVIIGLLDHLEPRQRRILYLRFFEEMSQSQIAEEIGTSQVHVGRLIASSLAQLRERLRRQDIDV